MQGIVSLLDGTHAQLVEEFWKELKESLEVSGIYSVRFPHLSYQVAERYDLERLDTFLQAMAATSAEFTVRTSGLGVFGGPRPVVYLPVVRSPELEELHQRVWRATSNSGTGLSEHYGAERWIPHITLAEGDVDSSAVAKIIERASGNHFRWEIKIHDLVVLTLEAGRQEITLRYNFGGQR